MAGIVPSGVNRATAILHAVADRPLENIQPDVTHIRHGSLLGVSESASAEFSLCKPSAFLSTYTFKLSRNLSLSNQEIVLDKFLALATRRRRGRGLPGVNQPKSEDSVWFAKRAVIMRFRDRPKSSRA